MWRSTRLAMALLITLLISVMASPAWAARPFGLFGGQAGGGNAGGGVMKFHGWCLDDDGVRAVDFYVDGATVGRALYGSVRAGVTQRHPGFPDSEAAGFSIAIDTTRFDNGLHEIQPLCISESGETQFLNARTFELTNVTHDLHPFGGFDFPSPNAEVYGKCDLLDPYRRYTIIEGWALDAGVEIGDRGVGYVELLIDGAIFANSRRDCAFHPVIGEIENCYGLVRTDIERVYPGLVDAPLAGFRFAIDVGALIDFGYAQGAHVLTARVGDISGQVANVDEQGVSFLCAENVSNEGTIGRLALPRPGREVSGDVHVVGWALDWNRIDEIQVWMDGLPVGNAFQGFARPNVTSRYPSYPRAELPGFLFILDSTGFADGPHNLEVFVIDRLGERTLLGEREIKINNLIVPI